MKATVIVMKGNMEVSGIGVKMNMLNVIFRFMEMACPKTELLQDDACMVLEMGKAEEGDARWCLDNVFSKVYIDGTFSDGEAIKRAERLYDVYTEAGGKNQAGLGLVRHFLNQFMLMQKSASIFMRR